MATRGKIIKTETPEQLRLLRPMVVRRTELLLDRSKCCGCNVCRLVCPREAISVTVGQVTDGRMTAAPVVNIDESLCSLCGECAASCPVHAYEMTVDGKPEIPVIRFEAFPNLLRANRVNQAAASASTETGYIAACPTGSISATIERDEEGHVTAVSQVEVNRRTCISCTRCMEQGPAGAFTVTKPYQGRVYLDVSLCPEGCQACADVCPSKTIRYDGARVSVDERFCIHCGACEHICPAPGAIRNERRLIMHTPIESGAWAKALDKLVSYREVSAEYDRKGQVRRRRAVVKGLLREMVE
ncbi:MAG: 4Fe-4S binding protein [Anaerolineae bacterium]|jgi:4Fe-4S ferredoxin|nr:4Fe-4S binding protein [Chloroflexota bacterium]